MSDFEKTPLNGIETDQTKNTAENGLNKKDIDDMEEIRKTEATDIVSGAEAENAASDKPEVIESVPEIGKSEFAEVAAEIKKSGKPKDAKRSFGRLMKYILKNNRGVFITMIVAILVQTVTMVGAMLMMQPLVDQGIIPAAEQAAAGLEPDMTRFFTIIAITASLFVLSIIGSYLYNLMSVKLYTQVETEMREEMFEHMQKLPVKFFDSHTHGEVMSRYTNDIDTLRQFIAGALPQMVSSALMIIGVFVVMLIMSPMLTLFVLVTLAVMLFATGKIGLRSGRFFAKQQREIGRVNGYIEEYIEGQKVVKVFCHEDETKANFDKINEDWQSAATAAHTNANILMPIIGNISYFQYAMIAVIGGIFIINGQFNITIGILAAFLPLSRQFSGPIGQAAQQFNNIMLGLAGAERIFALLDEKPERDDGYVTLVNAVIDEKGNITESEQRTGHWAWKHPHQADGTITYKELKGDVEFEDVTFEYVEGKPVLHDVSMYAKSGQKVALVGSTGAGKTTITNLINRFYDVPDGKIRYDGINITKIKKEDLRSSLAMVLQDTHLFTGTVMDNIRYGKLDASDEDCIEAAKLANAYSFIMHLPEGFETKLTADGANLSQGQRQLLAIARAAVADPPVLILDEATSSIDTRTEMLIEKGMDKLMEGRTVFVIAHRLSTVRNSDVILVLENGRIIERGNHEQLLEQRGKYYSLYTGMFELS